MSIIQRRGLLTRRELLRLGGAGVGGALFSTLLRERAFAQGMEPYKVIFLMTNHGVHPSGFQMGANGSTLQSIGGAFSALNEFRSDITVTRGLGYSYGGEHFVSSGAFLTNTPSRGRASDARATGRSFDHWLAEVLRSRWAPSNIAPLAHIATQNDSNEPLSYESAGLPVRTRRTPEEVWDDRFSRFTPPSTTPPPVEPPEPGEEEIRQGIERRARQAALTALDNEYARLRRTVNADEGRKLEETHARIRQLELRRIDALDSGSSGGGGNPTVPTAECSVPDAPGSPRSADRFDAIADIVVEALACNTEVATIRYGGGMLDGRWIRDRASHHDLHHASDAGARNSVTEWQAGRIARLIGRLRDKPFGSGNLLDRTLLVWTNEVSIAGAGSHIGNDLPVFLAGGLGGTFQTGRYLRFGEGDRTMSSLLVSIANAVGAVIPNSLGGPDGFGMMDPDERQLRNQGVEVDDIFNSGGPLRRPTRGPVPGLLA